MEQDEKERPLQSPSMETARLIDEDNSNPSSSPASRSPRSKSWNWSRSDGAVWSPDAEGEARAAGRPSNLKRHLRNQGPAFWVLHGILLLVSSSLALVGVMSLAISTSSYNRGSEVMWSPVLDAVPVLKTRFNETFMYPTRYPSRFSHGQESEDEWRKWTAHPMLNGQNGTIAVSEETVNNIAQSYSPEWKESIVRLSHAGETRYMGQIAMSHHLHCLNILRHAVHPEIYGSAAGGGHLDHCIESLREVLMCNPHGGEVIFFHWMEDSDKPYPDYNTWHRCRDPNAILDWALDHAVNIRGPLGKPDDAFVLQSPPY